MLRGDHRVPLLSGSVSKSLLHQAIEDLPRALRENILGYTSFVEDVVAERAATMDIKLDPEQRDRVVFLAGLLHLRSVVAGQLALVEVTLRGDTDRGVRGLRIAGEDLRPSSDYVHRMRQLRRELDELLLSAGFSQLTSRLSDAISLVASTEH